MTAIQLNAEIARSLAMIGDDETLLARAARYLKRLTTPKPDPTLMTKEEFFARVDAARQGPTYRLRPGETVDDLIKRVVG